MLNVLDIAGIHPDMRTSASVETCSLSIRQCQQTAIARIHCINSGHTNISVEFCLSLWNKFGLLLLYDGGDDGDGDGGDGDDGDGDGDDDDDDGCAGDDVACIGRAL